MSADLDILLGQLQRPDPSTPSGRVVRSMDGTSREAPYTSAEGAEPFVSAEGVDGLFGASVAYHQYKKESPRHRLILWMTLRGQRVKEIAQQLRCTPQTVTNVKGQPWFQEAFCRLSTEIGKDAVQTFLEGEVLPTMQHLVALRDSAESQAVQKAACDSILDRFFGKPVAKTETKLTGTIETTVYDVAKLQAEAASLDKQLAARGIVTGAN